MGCRRIKIIHLVLAMVPVAMLLAVVARVRQAHWTTCASACESSLFYIGAELVNYRDRYGNFPPASVLDKKGKPMHSWRAILYRELDHDFRQAYDFSKPWDSPANIVLADHPPRMFTCRNNQGEPARYTNYVALIDPHRSSADYIHAQAPKHTKVGGILLIEYPNSHVRWTEPTDLSLDELGSVSSGQDPGGIGVLFEDRTVRRVSKDELMRLLKPMGTEDKRKSANTQ